MSQLTREINAIQSRETVLATSYPTGRDEDDLRMVFLFPYGHGYSLMCNGPMALYDRINRDTTLPARAERALQYDCLIRDGNRLTTPDGDMYRSIESAAPVHQADVIGVSVTNAGDLHSVFRLLDLAGIPRHAADRIPGVHPLVVGGQGGLANPEVLADYLDVVALGEAEKSLPALLRAVHAHRHTPDSGTSLHEQLARIPGLYVPTLYESDLVAGGGVSAVRPALPTVPAEVCAQWLALAELHDAHFAYPITDGTAAGMIPLIGCRHSCLFCTLRTPPFRPAPLKFLLDYIDRLEELGVPKIIISAPTFTQYKYRTELLARIRAYRDRATDRGIAVSTIIGSVRADEMTPDYLRDVNELGDFGHLFTELDLTQSRGIVTIAPEFAAADLVALYGKTMPPERVDAAIDRCREAGDAINTIMLYFIIGAPGERHEDRLAIADRARGIRDRLQRPDASVIIKLHQFMPEPGTPAQRLAMTDPALIEDYVRDITDRLRTLVGEDTFAEHYRVQCGETNRLYLEAVCLRGDRRVGHVLEHLYDRGADLTSLSRQDLLDALSAHGLDFDRHLRHIDDPVLPWHTVNEVDPDQEKRLMAAIAQRTAAA
ncbi:B12-binding domain-containing radical SAM protein [Streptomyces sp. NPDC058471]|uniref:B12-binding domain-containing radical SAM protein n=1 Tax=Streptomyces sp. NPDC058471 TaxID=3346516 RepID=UPI00364F7E63